MNGKKNQQGSALVYILIAIALLAALTATFMDSSSQQTSSQNTFNTVTELNSQINFIRSAIQECVLTYPEGEPNMASVVNTPYPVNPSSTYFPTGAPPDDIRASDDTAANLRCPGNPGVDKKHAKIFGGSSGKFLPPPPKLFNAWTYYSGSDGVFFFTSTDKSDAFLMTALAKLDDQYSECEADVIDNSANTGALDITNDNSDIQCPGNSYCFRVWMIANPSASTAYVVGSDEEAAGCP
jgi:hypothetical protein